MFHQPHTPHSNRRSRHHDYRNPGVYMITISKDKTAPDFSYLQGDPQKRDDLPKAIPTPTGTIIETQIKAIEEDTNFKIEEYVIMPDHLHILWRVKRYLPKEFGYYVGLFKSRCTKNWRHILRYTTERPLFTPKFNDRIAYNKDMSERFRKYILDNPRRRRIRTLIPQLSQSAHRIRLGEMEFHIFGNFQLLRYPQIVPAIVSSRSTPEENTYFQRLWEETIRCGGVFISPFISHEEKVLRDRLLEANGSIIRIVADGIGPRYKPSGSEFDLCIEGRCLHIGAPRQSMHKDPLRRSYCLNLNKIARWITNHPQTLMVLIQNKEP
ncbi:MAG: transposase [Muribaculaceae bacterium]|nr:transposase [Muribaculaceae bacterium]